MRERIGTAVPLWLREAPVSQAPVSRTGEPLPVDAVMSMNNARYAGTGVEETVGQQHARAADFFSAIDPMGNTMGSAPGFLGAL